MASWLLAERQRVLLGGFRIARRRGRGFGARHGWVPWRQVLGESIGAGGQHQNGSKLRRAREEGKALGHAAGLHGGEWPGKELGRHCLAES